VSVSCKVFVNLLSPREDGIVFVGTSSGVSLSLSIDTDDAMLLPVESVVL
jgi:hypothetical protein